MTIDESIEHLRNAKGYEIGFSVYDKEHEQLAEWLEELKELRELKETYRKGMETSYSTFMYKKAIDDFEYACVQLIKKEQDTRYGYLDGMDIREIAKQLKGGVSNVN